MRTVRHNYLLIPKLSRHIPGALLLLALIAAGPARAQYDYSLNYQTNTISVSSNWVGNGTYVIGSNTYHNVLIINSGGVLSNGIVYMGYAGGGSNNTVLVTGGGIWSNASTLNIGLNEGGNSLIISNGGLVVNADSTTIGSALSASSNTVLVTGAGSMWISQNDILVGQNGFASQLIVQDGGVVVTTNNSGGEFIMGNGLSSGHAITVNNGTIWAGGTLTVGRNGHNTSLTITNGGTAIATSGIIGGNISSTNNTVLVAGGGLFITNGSNTAVLDVRRGELTMNGGSITTDRLLLTNGLNSVITFNSGTLISRGTTVSNFQNFVIGDTGSGGATFIANGGTHQMTNGLVVGNVSAGNNLIVSNSALLINSLGYVGFTATSSNNSAIVTGTGSVWSNRTFLYMGYSGGSNRLTVSNGGKVLSSGGVIGFLSAASNNVVTVTGTGSVWSNQSTTEVGSTVGYNTLIITNGGRVVNATGNIGMGASSNLVVVSGNGARWDNLGNLFVGTGGSTNTLRIGSGGTVVASNAVVGLLANSVGNRLNLTGGSLFVTNAAGDATLDIRRGTLSASAGSSIIARHLSISPTGIVAITQAQIQISGMTTNSGTFTMLNSVGTFGTVVNHGAWITDPTTNVFLGNHTISSSGYISAGAGDVYKFASNFVNESTQTASYNTLNTTPGASGASGAKFVFEGTNTLASTGYTQIFSSAGIQLTGGFVGTPSSATETQQVSSFAAVTGFQSNFALDRLELGNNGTNSLLMLMDSFPGDGEIAALFVNDLWLFGNSHLILSNNTALYFVNSNNWTAANYTLLGNAELHQLVLDNIVATIPEPSVALMWLAGAATLWTARRRRQKRSV